MPLATTSPKQCKSSVNPLPSQEQAVIEFGNGSATWIGNSDSKSYFMTAAHLVNAATNVMTTYDGTVIQPVARSVFHDADGDFGLLVYNGVLDPSLFGGESAVIMDLYFFQNFSGEETTIVGYGNLIIGGRSLGRTRSLSTSFLSAIASNNRTRSDIADGFNADSPFAGVATGGDSGGGVFLRLQETDVLIGAISSTNNVDFFNYTNLFAHQDLINSIVPAGVFTWYSEFEAIPRCSSDLIATVE